MKKAMGYDAIKDLQEQLESEVETTPNLGLKKQGDNDVYNHDFFNDNWEVLDEFYTDITNKSEQWDKTLDNVLILENIKIMSMGWKKVDDGLYKYEYLNNKVTPQHFPTVAVHREDMDNAQGLYSVESQKGKIVLYSLVPLKDNIEININLTKGVM